LGLQEDEARSMLGLRAAAEGLSVRQVEELVRSYSSLPGAAGGKGVAGTTRIATERPREPAIVEIEDMLSERLSTRVRVISGKRRGRIVVEFGSREDLSRITAQIAGSPSSGTRG
jgi:ParB family chromosome partitioning protein